MQDGDMYSLLKPVNALQAKDKSAASSAKEVKQPAKQGTLHPHKSTTTHTHTHTHRHQTTLGVGKSFEEGTQRTQRGCKEVVLGYSTWLLPLGTPSVICSSRRAASLLLPCLFEPCFVCFFA